MNVIAMRSYPSHLFITHHRHPLTGVANSCEGATLAGAEYHRPAALAFPRSDIKSRRS
jgi:hypothetical protein